MLLRYISNYSASVFVYMVCLFISIYTRKLIYPVLISSWHHSTVYLRTNTRFIKIYLNGVRGKNEEYVYNWLRSKNCKFLMPHMQFKEFFNIQIISSPFAKLDHVTDPRVLNSVRRKLQQCGVEHGDLNKNVFIVDGNLCILDFAFSSVNGIVKYKDEYYSKRNIIDLTQIVIIAPYTDVLEEIINTLPFDQNVIGHFIRNTYWKKYLTRLARLFSSTLFTRLYFRLHGLDKYQGSYVCFFDNPNIQYFDTKFIKSFCGHCHIHYWNPISNSRRVRIEKMVADTMSSYGKRDSERFDLHYAPQFYKFKSGKLQSENSYLGRAAYFVGQVKPGRAERLSNLIKNLNRLNIVTKFQIVGKGLNDELQAFKVAKQRYVDIEKVIQNCQFVVDFPSDIGGLSLRPLEAIYYNKKLIVDELYNQQELADLNLDYILVDNNTCEAAISQHSSTSNYTDETYNNTLSILAFVNRLKNYVPV
jgi:hypothetical protein